MIPKAGLEGIKCDVSMANVASRGERREWAVWGFNPLLRVATGRLRRIERYDANLECRNCEKLASEEKLNKRLFGCAHLGQREGVS